MLDTCAAIWLTGKTPLSPAAEQAIDRAGSERRTMLVSPITAWEVALKAGLGRLVLAVAPRAWFEGLTAIPGVAASELSATILIESTSLPGTPPRDPADRIIIATARDRGLRIVTRDRLILDYAAQGHVLALEC